MSQNDIVLRPHLRVRVRELFAQPLETAEVLQQEVNHHAKVVEIVAKKKRPCILPLSQALTRGLTELLQGVTENTSKQHRHLIQAACRYFVDNQEDDEHDLGSDTGLDDDAEVFVAVATSLGRQDLVEKVKPHIVGQLSGEGH